MTLMKGNQGKGVPELRRFWVIAVPLSDIWVKDRRSQRDKSKMTGSVLEWLNKGAVRSYL